MPKAKKPRLLQNPSASQGHHAQGHTNHKPHRKMRSFAKVSNTFSKDKNRGRDSSNNNQGQAQKKSGLSSRPGQQQHQHRQHRRPIVPFGRKDRILLVGEGDFSFARSLVTQHRCKNVLATSYDSRETLYGKYPQVEGHIQDILGAGVASHLNGHDDDEPQNGDGDEASALNDKGDNKQQQQRKSRPGVLFSIDARKLGLPVGGGGKEIRIGFPLKEHKRAAWQEAEARKKNPPPVSKVGGSGGPWDVICFNFPHVGGISTDVNRQVRANQELLVAFFKACVPLLSPRPKPVDPDDEEEGGWGSSEESEDGSGHEDDESESGDDGMMVVAKSERRTEPGQILVSLFEGEPYTLWNIRDLARHAGLRVVTSFKFPWACYQGYSHARTIGEIEGKDGGRGGWRGEDREARMYVFELKEDENSGPQRNPWPSSAKTSKKAKKRPADTDDSGSD